MNVSRPTDASDTTFKNLQSQFIKWATNWTHQKDHMQQASTSVPDIVIILQALGFKIRHFDVCPPEETTALKDGDRGIRLIASCNYSGQRFYLEKPTHKDDCKCAKLVDDQSEDGLWEITDSADQSSMTKAIQLHLIPSLPEEQYQIIYCVTNYLICMMHGSIDTNTSGEVIENTSSASSDTSDIYYDLPKQQSLPAENVDMLPFSNLNISDSVVSFLPKDNYSPSRSKSLDASKTRSSSEDVSESRSFNSREHMSEFSSSELYSSESGNCSSMVSSSIDSSLDIKNALEYFARASENLYRGVSLIQMRFAKELSTSDASNNNSESMEEMVPSLDKSSRFGMPASNLYWSAMSASTPHQQLQLELGLPNLFLPPVRRTTTKSDSKLLTVWLFGCETTYTIQYKN